ncbi:hypothetical protein FZH48_26170, partial [Salmonella enterica]|nr:hypothetical protein [Salmonella enterica]
MNFFPPVGNIQNCQPWTFRYLQLEHAAKQKIITTARHRGDFDNHTPENSLGAFQNSYEKCRPSIETDVRLTKDGKAVLFHDLNVGKMTNPDYDPELDSGTNTPLKDLTPEILSLELQNFWVINYKSMNFNPVLTKKTFNQLMRTDIKWLLTSTKSSVITSLDVDSIENYSPTKILINNKARPKMSYPPYQMKSSLSWELGFYKKPNGSSVSLKAVGDSISNDWRNGVCLYSKENSVGVAYSCNDDNIQGWGFNKQLVVRMADDNSMYIQDPATKLCLTGNNDHNQGITYWAECHESSQWIRYGDNTFENKVFANTYLSFNVDGEWKGSRFGLVKNDGFSNYKYWKMESS